MSESTTCDLTNTVFPKSYHLGQAESCNLAQELRDLDEGVERAHETNSDR